MRAGCDGDFDLSKQSRKIIEPMDFEDAQGHSEEAGERGLALRSTRGCWRSDGWIGRDGPGAFKKDAGRGALDQ
jgi:hypothetical protein